MNRGCLGHYHLVPCRPARRSICYLHTRLHTHAQADARTHTLRTARQEQRKQKRLENLLGNCRAVLDVCRSSKEGTVQVQWFF